MNQPASRSDDGIPEPTNDTLMLMMAAWNDTLGSPLTRYAAMYRIAAVHAIVRSELQQKPICYTPCDKHIGQAFNMPIVMTGRAAPAFNRVCPICNPPSERNER